MSHGAVTAVHAAPVISTTMRSSAATTVRAAPSSSRLYAVGSNACSFAMRSVHDTKETFLLVCIGFLDALDSLQSKLQLPTSLVKDLKRRLSKMIDRSLTRPVSATMYTKIQQAEHIGELIAESETWGDVAKPEEVKGFVHWLLAVMKWLNELVVGTTIGACRRIFILIMSLPGVPTACSLFCRIVDMVEHTLQITTRSPSLVGTNMKTTTPRQAKRPKYDHYMDDSNLTAVVLEYREKECMVPVNINRRIQQFMHFEIPLRSFEATVRLPAAHASHRSSRVAPQLTRQSSDQEQSLSSSSSGGPSSSSPRSIPVSPRERRKFELIYENYFDDVLYQARDKLRLQRAVNLTGEKNRQIPRFNKHECDQEVHLTCGRNCAVKEGPGMYRSVRGTVPILRNRYVYFEMELSSGHSPNGVSLVDSDVSACIGIAPRSMPLNTLVGTARYSVGFFSAGHVLVSGQRRQFQSVDSGFTWSSTVGVLVFIEDDNRARNRYPASMGTDGSKEPSSAAAPGGVAHAEVQFSVNGSAVRDASGEIVVARFSFPSRFELYPTVSLHTAGVRVYAQFSSPDIAAFDPSCFRLAPEDAEEVVCLDGLRVPL